MSTSRISNLRTDTFPASLMGPQFDYAIVESPAAIEFLDLKESTFAPEQYGRGRAFGPDSELHWLKRLEGYHLVYISDKGECLPEADGCIELEPLPTEEPRNAFLWGEFNTSRGVFLEGRIPSALSYPNSFPAIPNGGRAAIRLRHYRFMSHGEWRRVCRCSEVISMKAVHE